jgi:ATP-dependent DNA ligase
MMLPTLYKKTSTGAIQYWKIAVHQIVPVAECPVPVGVIVTEHGQLGTDSPQTTEDTISEGKNIGKKNETTAVRQAELEAQAKWEKQKKKGYVESLEAAQKGEVDEIIEGGIVPMLAQSFADHGHKIKYPCYAQPKLDGIRCIAIVKDGKCTLWTRTRKPITSVPHIVEEIERVYGKLDIILDGELYNHSLKKDFEKIVSMVRQEEPAEGCEIVQYHIYDVVTDQTFGDRWENFLSRLPTPNEPPKYCFMVSTGMIHSEDQVQTVFEASVKMGFEGLMLRNKDAKYVNKRSYDLQKVKEFEDAEFDIVGVEEGRGKLAGKVGSFVCVMPNGKTFLAKMAGDTDRLREYFENPSLWQGKRLTVKYQGLTGKEGVPRFPVGVAIRDYE